MRLVLSGDKQFVVYEKEVDSQLEMLEQFEKSPVAKNF